jgi:hypothetical protein
LTGITKIADTLPREQLLGLLNAYADCLVGVVHDYGGEVLKFMGDGILVVFGGAKGHACRRALDAAEAARSAMAQLNQERSAAGHKSCSPSTSRGPISPIPNASGLTPSVAVCGKLVKARGHLERELALYDLERQRSLASVYAYDPRLAGLAGLAFALSQLGYPEQALARCREAVDDAERLSHPTGLAYALHHACMLDQVRRDALGVRQRAAALIALAAEHGFALWQAAGVVFDGWALAERGRAAEGIARIEDGLDAYRATGAGLFVPYFLALLGMTHGPQAERRRASACWPRPWMRARERRALVRGGGPSAQGELLLISRKRRDCSTNCNNQASDQRAHDAQPKHFSRCGGRKLITTPEGRTGAEEAALRRDPDYGAHESAQPARQIESGQASISRSST